MVTMTMSGLILIAIVAFILFISVLIFAGRQSILKAPSDAKLSDMLQTIADRDDVVTLMRYKNQFVLHVQPNTVACDAPTDLYYDTSGNYLGSTGGGWGQNMDKLSKWRDESSIVRSVQKSTNKRTVCGAVLQQ